MLDRGKVLLSLLAFGAFGAFGVAVLAVLRHRSRSFYKGVKIPNPQHGRLGRIEWIEWGSTARL